MKIGRFRLDTPVILAPMAGVTDLPFRNLARKLGAGMVVGEMTASNPELRGTRKSLLRQVHRAETRPRSIQIVGWDPAMLADAAQFNVEQGADIIDINMGCPAKKVCKRLAGSALLGDEDLVKTILETVVAAVDVPVTLKIRTGTDLQNRNAQRIGQIAEDAGIQSLAVHGRTRACRFHGAVEYETVRQVKRILSIPVVANGDIDSPEKALEVMRFTGADAVMIGRGAHGEPWLPGQIGRFLKDQKTTSVDFPDKVALILSHIAEIHRFYGDDQGVRVARKHIKWYLGKLKPVAKTPKVLLTETDAENQVEILQCVFEKLIHQKLPCDRSGFDHSKNYSNRHEFGPALPA
ncbi:MAG: tRNA dihydrouridine synthase DusB [Pseudomonadota bacterium]